MVCVKCGKEVKDGTKFCTNCGTEVQEKDDKLTYTQNTSTPASTTESTGDGKGTASLVLGIVSFVVPCVGFITSIVGLILGICAKKSGKKTAGIILNSIALGLIIISSILLWSFGYLAAWAEGDFTVDPPTVNPVTPVTPSKPTTVTGKTFTFGDFEITIGNTYSFTTINSSYSQYNGKDVVKVPVTLKNIGTTNNHLNMFYHKYYGPTGTSLPKLGSYFSSDALDYGYLDPNESQVKYIYLLYDGDGKYKIEFDNYKEEKTVYLNIKK